MRYGNQIKERRIALDLTQAELGARIGRSHKRISEFELETRAPDPEAKIALCRVLNLPAFSTETELLPALCRHLVKPRFYVRPGERSTEHRLWAARTRAPEWAHRINDCLVPKRKALLNLCASDSCWEALILAHLMATSARQVSVQLLAEGYYQHVVLHPTDRLPAGHLRFPALSVQWGEESLLFVPQVPLRTMEGAEFTPDFLVGVRGKGPSKWIDLEVDGEGHDGSGDRYRMNLLGMRTVRYRPAQIRARDFVETLFSDLLAR